MSTLPLSTPNPSQVTIHGQTYDMLAFYYPGYNMAWDTYYQVPYFGNFYPSTITVTFMGIAGTFSNAEAAFQASKWWNQDTIRQRFETLDGPSAFSEARNLDSQHVAHTGNYGGVGASQAMLTILKEKYNLPAFNAALKLTGSAYLLEHDAKVRPNASGWSDNNDGSGANRLGTTIMDIRNTLFGLGAPSGSYSVADFSKAVQPHP